jgi:hypothetical protein
MIRFPYHVKIISHNLKLQKSWNLKNIKTNKYEENSRIVMLINVGS